MWIPFCCVDTGICQLDGLSSPVLKGKDLEKKIKTYQSKTFIITLTNKK